MNVRQSYIIDEADCENHSNGSISDKPSWKAAYVDRIERVVSRDKNHPSVIFWSLGNEGSNGDNFDAMAERARQMGHTRLSGCVWDWVDQALNKPGEPENHYFYGGDFGDKPIGQKVTPAAVQDRCRCI